MCAYVILDESGNYSVIIPIGNMFYYHLFAATLEAPRSLSMWESICSFNDYIISLIGFIRSENSIKCSNGPKLISLSLLLCFDFLHRKL